MNVNFLVSLIHLIILVCFLKLSLSGVFIPLCIGMLLPFVCPVLYICLSLAILALDDGIIALDLHLVFCFLYLC